jgi:hypothetical protein
MAYYSVKDNIIIRISDGTEPLQPDGPGEATYVAPPIMPGAPEPEVGWLWNSCNPTPPEEPAAPPEGGPPPTEAPTVVDAPHVSQTGSTLTCTLGIWNGEPTSRTYQWQSDGVDVAGATAQTYEVQSADVGHSFTCIQTATNAIGTSEPVTSNAVVAA